MRKFDISKIPYKEWKYEDDEWEYGVILNPKDGVTFWGQMHNLDDAGAYGMTFNKFLSKKEFSTPSEIIEEIKEILINAIIKKE